MTDTDTQIGGKNHHGFQKTTHCFLHETYNKKGLKMIKHTIRNTMDLVRLRIFAKNLQTYENRILDLTLRDLVEDHFAGLCDMHLEKESVSFDYHDPEQEFIRRLSL